MTPDRQTDARAGDTALSGSVNERQLGELLSRLAAAIAGSGFRPDVLVFVETGARIPALALGKLLGVPVHGVSARRGGDGLKKRLAPLLSKAPAWITRALRWLEEVSRLHRLTRRHVVIPAGLDLRGRAVLLFDDASDTGRTIEVVSAALAPAGLERPRLRVAVIAATTVRARRRVDFWALDRNVRFPWSPDMRRDAP